jgi:hypothetical protein
MRRRARARQIGAGCGAPLQNRPAVGLAKALDKVKEEDHILDARR